MSHDYRSVWRIFRNNFLCQRTLPLRRQSKRAIVGGPQFLGRKHLGDCGIECHGLLPGSVTELCAGEPVSARGAQQEQDFLSGRDQCLEHERLAIQFVDERMTYHDLSGVATWVLYFGLLIARAPHIATGRYVGDASPAMEPRD